MVLIGIVMLLTILIKYFYLLFKTHFVDYYVTEFNKIMMTNHYEQRPPNSEVHQWIMDYGGGGLGECAQKF